MLINKQKCVICGRRFTLNKKNIYVVFERQAIMQAFSRAEKHFDATDCPHCGCQNVLAERLPKIQAVEDGGDGSEVEAN